MAKAATSKKNDVIEVEAEEAPLEIRLEETISIQLVKANVTDQVMKKLEDDYLKLTINGVSDKEGYLAVREGRMVAKSTRVLAQKVCKKGREAAVAEQKAWIAKENEVTGRISKVEDYLQQLEDDYEAEKEKIKADKLKAEAERLIGRTRQLKEMGVDFDGTNYNLGDVSYELSNIRECDDDIFNDVILPKYKKIFDANEIIRLEELKKKEEAEEEQKRQREELERREAEIKRQEQEIRSAQEKAEKERLQVEANARKLVEDKRKMVLQNRAAQLYELGMTFNFQHDAYVLEDVNVDNKTEICLFDDKEWDELIARITPVIKQRVEERNQKAKEAQQEREKIAAEKAVEEERQRVKEQERLEAVKKQQELAKATDKTKWLHFIQQLSEVKMPDFRSGQYRGKASQAREKIDEIKDL